MLRRGTVAGRYTHFASTPLHEGARLRIPLEPKSCAMFVPRSLCTCPEARFLGLSNMGPGDEVKPREQISHFRGLEEDTVPL
jgi:hypothetical protein